MAGAGGYGSIGQGLGGGGISGQGYGDARVSGLEQGGRGVPVEIGNNMIGFANPLTGEVTVPGEAFGLPAGSTVTVSPSDPDSAVASVATPAGTMTFGLDTAISMFGGGDQGFGNILGGGQQNLGDFGSQLERETGAVLAPNPDPGTGYDFGLAGPATGQFGGPGFSIGSFGPGDVAIAMDEAGLDPGFNGIEGTQTKGEIAADFAAGFRGGSRLGGPSDEEGDPATNAFDTAALDGGINGAVGFGPGASDHELGVGAAMSAGRGGTVNNGSQINAGDLGLQADPTNAVIEGLLGEMNAGAFGPGAAIAAGSATNRGSATNAFDQDIADISAAQIGREGTIADINAEVDGILGGGQQAAIDGAIGGENAVGPGLAGADFGGQLGTAPAGGDVAAFGADGLSDGPGMSYGGGDVGIDIAAAGEGFDMGSRVGDFANPNVASTGENAFDNGSVAASNNSNSSEGLDTADMGATGGFDGSDITGGVADMGMGGLGDGSGREAGIGAGFDGIGNAFDGGNQTANDMSSSSSSESSVAGWGGGSDAASGGNSGRGGRGQGEISGGWGWDGGGWDGSADGISGGFGRDAGGEGRGAAVDTGGGGFGWG